MSDPETDIPAWEKPEHKTPRVEEPDTRAQRIISVLLAGWPLIIVFLFALLFIAIVTVSLFTGWAFGLLN